MAGISTNPNSLIGKYIKPDVYIDEIDLSTRPRVISPEGTVSLVIGVSKKGPVNRPVLITSQQQFISIFGDIDRHLQYKSSYFHRTCLNMLRSGPILALNLLLTDPDRDKIDFRNLSCATGFTNQLVKQMPYEDAYLKNDFWVRDPESLIFSADKNNNNVTNLLTFTNFSDKKITVWAFKSSLKGFDIPAIQWYGSEDELPSFINKNSLISDYLLKVIVVQGDYTNHQELSTSPIWSKYFTVNGLIPSNINNFIFNEPNLNILGNYDVSLIPFFRDNSGRDLYIENIINADTDSTGLFCGFRADLLQGSVDKGYIDIIGNWIALNSLDPTNEIKSVNFLSYDEQLTEEIVYKDVYLDRAGNTWGWQNSSDPLQPSRHAKHGNGFIEGLYVSTPFTNTTGAFGLSYDPGAYCVYQREDLVIDQTLSTLQVNPLTTLVAKPTYRTDLVVINSLGVVTLINGAELTTTSFSTVAVNPSIDQYPGAPRLLNSDIVIGVIRSERDIVTPGSGIPQPSSTTNYTYYPIAIDDNGWISPSIIIDNGSLVGNNILNMVFSFTQGQLTAQNVKGNRNMVFFNDFRTLITTANSVILDASGNKINLSDCTITITTALMSLKSINIIASSGVNILNSGNNTLIGSGPTRYLNFVTFYSFDDELLIGTHSMITKSSYTSTVVSSPYPYATEGVVGKDSKFYIDYINGKINSSDKVEGIVFSGLINFVENLGLNYIDIPNFADPYTTINPSDIIYVSGLSTESVSLNKNYTVLSAGNTVILGVPTLRIQVLENIVVQSGVTTKIYHYSGARYVKAYTINGILKVDFTPSDLSSPDPLLLPYLNEILMISGKSNFKQTLEIENLIATNQVAVNADRYPEIEIGDYIQALVDNTELDILSGEVGRHLTRIIDKKRNPSNDTQFILLTDAPIYVINASDVNNQIDYQTYVYKSFDKYITGYKGTALKGFKINSESLPDGTETRQAQILSLIGKGTPLFYSLSNRNKIKWRYLVDSFGLGLTSNSKQELVDLCGQKVSCLGFINSPSVKMFKKSTSPTFINKNGTLNYEWVAKGGNPSANNAFRYTLADGPGRSSVSYWHPWVIISDNNIPTTIPPASYVANTYMQKFLSRSGNVYSYTVAAGITNGIVTNITDLEIQLQDTDIENLIQAGINSISYKMDRDFTIDTELTAQVVPNSSLSLIHSRELLIDLENELYNMLLEYQWQFNTESIRAEVQDRADQICQRYVDRNGLYAYKNVMDNTNNTNETIDAQIGILYSYIEISKSMGIIINQVYVMKTGDLRSSGFTA